MHEFIDMLFNPDIAILRLSFILAAFASLSFGVIGSFVVAKRIGYMAGGISHCILGGVGLGIFLNQVLHISWAGPIGGAFAAAITAAIIIGVIGLKWKEREDSLIGLIWAFGMSAGLLFIDLTPGYFNLTSYLFGDISLITPVDVWAAIGLDLVIIAVCLLFFNRILATCFDSEFTTLRGISANGFYLLMLLLTALTVVMMVRIVGIVMVIALLTIPATTAGRITRSLRGMMIAAAAICLFCTWSGLTASFLLGHHFQINLSSGPVIILFSGIIYLICIAGNKLFSR